jgi:hypothetical protein
MKDYSEISIIVPAELELGQEAVISLYATFEQQLLEVGVSKELIRNYYRIQQGVTAEELQKLRDDENRGKYQCNCKRKDS